MIYNIKGKVYAPQFVSELGFNLAQDWDKAALKILFAFPSPPESRLLSSTQSVLYNIVKEAFGDNVFCDICTEPLPSTKNLAARAGLPSWYGWFSGRSVDEFDLLGISIAITEYEFTRTVELLKELNFPLLHSERVDDSRYPFTFMGGVAAGNSAMLDDIVDLAVLGLGERTIPALINAALSLGSIKKNKLQLIHAVKNLPGFYYPSAYKYSHTVKDGTLQHIYEGHLEGFPDVVKPDTTLPIELYGSSQDCQRFFSYNLNQNRSNVLASWGCAGSGACSFCLEGNVYGAWRERSLDSIEDALERSKKSSMSDSISYYSFNSNYYSDFATLLKAAYSYYDRVPVLNLRADVLAYELGFLKLMKAFNSNQVSIAVEGWGDRVRNQFYNKNLSFEEILKVADQTFKLRFKGFKLGYLESGYETKEDFEQGFEELRAIAALRDKHIAGTRIQVTVGGLVHFYGTPLYKYPRVMAYHSWQQNVAKTDYHFPYAALVSSGIEVKNIYDKKRVDIQQLVMDLGRLSGQVLAGSAGIEEELGKLGINPRAQFLEPATQNHPFQHLELSYNQKNFNSLGYTKKPVPVCLKTPASEGRGERVACQACEMCEAIDQETGTDIRHKAGQLSRKLPKTGSLADIVLLKKLKTPTYHYQYRVFYTEAGRYISKENLIRRLLSELQDIVKLGFYKKYRKLLRFGAGKLDFPTIPSSVAGYDLFVAGFSEEVTVSQEQITQLNSRLEGIQLLGIEQTYPPFLMDMVYLFKAEVSLPLDSILKAFESFKVKKKFRVYSSLLFFYREVEVPFHYKIVTKNGNYQVYFLMRPKVNPAFLFVEILQIQKLLEKVKLDIVGIFQTDGENCFTSVLDTGRVIDTASWEYVFA